MSLVCCCVSTEVEKATSKLAENLCVWHLYVPWTEASTGINLPHVTNTGDLLLYLRASC